MFVGDEPVTPSHAGHSRQGPAWLRRQRRDDRPMDLLPPPEPDRKVAERVKDAGRALLVGSPDPARPTPESQASPLALQHESALGSDLCFTPHRPPKHRYPRAGRRLRQWYNPRRGGGLIAQIEVAVLCHLRSRRVTVIAESLRPHESWQTWCHKRHFRTLADRLAAIGLR